MDDHVSADGRIAKVYLCGRSIYDKACLPQHNWEHIIRVLFRALIIAARTRGPAVVDYSILISAVILHDIGVTEGPYRSHAERGSEMARRLLVQLAYKREEIRRICECIKCHKDAEGSDTIEAKILFDADRLKKSGLGGAFASYRSQLELGESISKWAYQRKYRKRDLFTRAARQISEDGFREMDKHLAQVKSSVARRKDWTVVEWNLWRGPPP